MVLSLPFLSTSLTFIFFQNSSTDTFFHFFRKQGSHYDICESCTLSFYSSRQRYSRLSCPASWSCSSWSRSSQPRGELFTSSVNSMLREKLTSISTSRSPITSSRTTRIRFSSSVKVRTSRNRRRFVFEKLFCLFILFPSLQKIHVLL